MEKKDLLKLKKMYLIEEYEARRFIEYSYVTDYTFELITTTFFGKQLEPRKITNSEYHLVQKETENMKLGFAIYSVYEKNKYKIINPFPLELDFILPKHLPNNRNFTRGTVNYISYNQGLYGFLEDHIEGKSFPTAYMLRCYVKLRQIKAEYKDNLITTEDCKLLPDYIQNQEYSLRNNCYTQEKNEIIDKIINSSKFEFEGYYKPKYTIQIIYENGAVGIQNFRYPVRGNYESPSKYDRNVSNIFSSDRIIGYVVNKVYVRTKDIFENFCILCIPFYLSYNHNNFEFINGDYEYRVRLEECKDVLYDSYEEANADLKSFLTIYRTRRLDKELFEISENAQKIVDSILAYQEFVNEDEMVRKKTLKKNT